MCHLFGLSAAPRRVRATFWLMEAPLSLAEQSHGEPDGTGLGTFTADGTPLVEKQPLAAYADAAFATEAKTRESATFVAHIRFATMGRLDANNTHPFVQRDRVFAHNGDIGDLPALEAELGPYLDLVRGDTDSERYFALITKHVDDNGGDVAAGITAAATWIAENLPLTSINFVLVSALELWALRYPATHDLLMLDRVAGGASGRRPLRHAAVEPRRIGARSTDLTRHGAVVVATEPMDEDPGWSELRPGELLHVGPNHEVSRTLVLPHPPRRPMRLEDVEARVAATRAEPGAPPER
ncbi:MAG: class II glutamine amidotransferase [Labilithrix sp.]|nr:class II glutamine amidotransferase [Labilithrix sp.]MCW5835692.1 class II glutamine amidotransferase [Labilithrix sp.]